MVPFSASSRTAPGSVEQKIGFKPKQLTYNTIQDMFTSYLHLATRGSQFGGFAAFFQRNTGISNPDLNHMSDGEALEYILKHYASNVRGF